MQNGKEKREKLKTKKKKQEYGIVNLRQFNSKLGKNLTIFFRYTLIERLKLQQAVATTTSTAGWFRKKCGFVPHMF